MTWGSGGGGGGGGVQLVLALHFSLGVHPSQEDHPFPSASPQTHCCHYSQTPSDWTLPDHLWVGTNTILNLTLCDHSPSVQLRSKKVTCVAGHCLGIVQLWQCTKVTTHPCKLYVYIHARGNGRHL